MTNEQIIRMALEALESCNVGNWSMAFDEFAVVEAITALREALVEQAEQEPMYISKDCVKRGCACHYSVEVDGEPVAVYSAPIRTKDPCNPLQDLTDDEIESVVANLGFAQLSPIEVARAVIAADREKNK